MCADVCIGTYNSVYIWECALIHTTVFTYKCTSIYIIVFIYKLYITVFLHKLCIDIYHSIVEFVIYLPLPLRCIVEMSDFQKSYFYSLLLHTQMCFLWIFPISGSANSILIVQELKKLHPVFLIFSQTP